MILTFFLRKIKKKSGSPGTSNKQQRVTQCKRQTQPNDILQRVIKSLSAQLPLTYDPIKFPSLPQLFILSPCHTN